MKKYIALLAAAALCFSFSAAAFAEDINEELTAIEDAELVAGVNAVYEGENGSIIAETTARGIESDIVLNVYVDAEGLVEKIEVVSHGETPSIGGMALSEEYLSSYYGLDSAEGVDAYAGASITSKAIAECVTAAVNQYKSLNGIEFEAALTSEEILAAALEENLGEGYEELEAELIDGVTAVYASENGYGFCVEGKGHAEEFIKLVVFTDKNGIVKMINVIESCETEGIGSKVLAQTNLFFYYGGDKFAMIDMPGTVKIDVVSGATETSMAVFKLVMAAEKQFAAIG